MTGRAAALRSRWASVPGVVYPEDRQQEGEPGVEVLEELPPGMLTTAEAAKVLGVGNETAMRLLKASVLTVPVKVQGYRRGQSNSGYHWVRSQVEALAASRRPPEGWLEVKDAAAVLHVDSKRVYEWGRKGRLRMRRSSTWGNWYNAEDVQRLAAERGARHAK